LFSFVTIIHPSFSFCRALVTAANLTVNPLRRPSGGNIRRGSLSVTAADKERKLPGGAERAGDFASRATRRMSKRELVLEENLSGNQSNKEQLGSISEENKVILVLELTFCIDLAFNRLSKRK
jgi:hypothetical protein